MIKTMMNILKQDKEKFKVPRGVQDIIPITEIYDDGIFKVGKDKYEYSTPPEPLCPVLRATHSVERAIFLFR